MTRRTQQTSILEFIGTPGRGISRTQTQSNRAERINFTARSNTQLQFHGSDEEGDEVESDGSRHLDTFKLNKKKTRLEDDEHIDVTTQRTASSQTVRKKKVLQDSEDEENDFPVSEQVDTLPEAGPSVLRGKEPLRRTPSPVTTPPPPSSAKRDRNSSSRKRTRFVSSVDRESSPEVSPQNRKSSRPDEAASSSMRKKSRLEQRGSPVAGPPSSPTKRKTRGDGPISQEGLTQESTQPPTQEKISGRTRNRLGEVQKVDYVESDEDELLLCSTRSRRKCQVDEDWDSNVTPSMESVLDMKGKGRALDTQETQSQGIDSDSSLTPSPAEGDTPSRRTRSAVRRSRLARHPPSEPITPTRKNHRVVTKLKIFSSESEMGPESDDPLDDGLARRKRRLERREEEEEEEEDASQFPEIRLPARSGKGKRTRKRRRDPDETDDDEETIDSKKMLEEIELDEPVVLKNRMRDRTKKSEFQRNLDRLKRKKLARSGQPIALDTESESEQDDDEEEEEDDEYGDAGQIIIDGSDEDAIRIVDDESDFIVSDAEQVGEFDARMLPAEFRLSSYQDLEHHFKVISQYFTHLVVSGPTVISQSNSHYFKSALEAFRRRFQGTKDSLIASSVWKPGFRKSLETFPEFVVHELDEAVMGCDACHLTGRLSKFEGNLSGREYDSKTFEDLSDDSDSSDSGEEDGSLSKGPFRLGKYCRERAEVFHEFSHWEYELYQAYRIPYRQLLRRTNASLNRDSDTDGELDSEEEVKEIRPFVSYAGFTQDSIRDGDEVLEYFESMGYIKREWDRLDRMMKHAQKLDSYRR